MHEDSQAQKLPPARHRAKRRRLSGVPRIHPERADPGYRTQAELDAAVTDAMFAATNLAIANVPAAFINALRSGHDTVDVTIDKRPASLVLTESGEQRPDPDTVVAAWKQLRAAIATVTSAGSLRTLMRVGGWVRADLPVQVAIATITHHGQTINLRGAACTSRHRQLARTTTHASAIPALLLLPVMIRDAINGATGIAAGAAAATAASAAIAIGVTTAAAPHPNGNGTAETTGQIIVAAEPPAPAGSPSSARKRPRNNRPRRPTRAITAQQVRVPPTTTTLIKPPLAVTPPAPAPVPAPTVTLPADVPVVATPTPGPVAAPLPADIPPPADGGTTLLVPAVPTTSITPVPEVAPPADG